MNRDPHRDSERLRDDLAAYALGALDAADTAELERHIDGCESCRAELRWLSPAVDMLPASVPQLTPPESLRESLMATVNAEAASPVAGPARTKPARASWWQGLRGAMLRPATGMAVLILLVVGVGAGYLLRGSGEPVPNTVVPAEAVGTAQAAATLERHGDSATLHVSQLPALDEDEVYEVWVQRAGVMEPQSTFVLGMDGTAEAAVPGPLENADAVLVTAEPRPGSQRPTTPPLLEAPL